MTIRNRLTVQFVTLVGIILLTVLLSIYFATEIITKKLFYDRLKERADIAAQIFLEEDELSKTSYSLVQQKFVKKLPGEIIQIFDSTGNRQFIADNPKTFFPLELLKRVRKEKVVYYAESPNQVVGIYYEDNQGNFVIFVAAPDDTGKTRLNDLIRLMIISYIIALIIIYISGRYFAKKALQPVPKVISQVNRITASNLHLRVDTGENKDEIAALASTFNDMLTRLESSFEMQKTFVSNASHELRTPITSIIGELEVFLSKVRTVEEYKEAMQSVLKDAQQLNELTTGLLNIAQLGFGDPEINPALAGEEIRMDELLMEVEKEVISLQPQAKIILDYNQLPEDSSKLLVKGNRQLLSIGFANLFNNAIKFSDNNPVQCSICYVNNHLEIRVIDKGIGIASDELEKVFQPFYRSQQARDYAGHGIGLALVQKIMELHHAKISLRSDLGKGTEVLIAFG